MEKLKKKKLRGLEARVLENEERFAKSCSKGELSRNSGFKSENGDGDWEDIYAIWENRKSQRSGRGFQRPLKEKKVKSKGETNKLGRKAGKNNQHKSISFYVEEYEQQLLWREDYFESFVVDKDRCLCRDSTSARILGLKQRDYYTSVSREQGKKENKYRLITSCYGAEVEEFVCPRTSRMSSLGFSVLGLRRNTSASTRIFNVALISKERRGVDLQGHSDAQVR
ncbi:hypothetical protein PIB30_018459 [Stylosanthes scabra]|uniref:Uncharacterized protein n=1 Tax=Stylosanthes scabra TaxID=79078 RepID=A0ABU6V8Q2_9FABA|nr:hypothetical protein [Stylosanthes scabra]